MIRSVVIDAPAKVNLFLRILGRRQDGYHDLETLFQSISLSDRVTVTWDPEGPREERLTVAGPDLGPIDSNLAIRAARSFRVLTGVKGSIQVDLEKFIPAGAGLGGGSSNAAAVLKCLSDLTGYSASEQLHHLASELGSDVPFFLDGGPTCFGSGRGEELHCGPSLPQAPLVVAMPPVHVSTAEAYQSLADARGYARASSGVATEEGVEKPSAGAAGHHDWREATDWERVVREGYNDFEPLIAATHPQVSASIEGLKTAGARYAILSGSGAASFGVFENPSTAEGAARGLTDEYGWPFVAVSTRSLAPEPIPLAEGG